MLTVFEIQNCEQVKKAQKWLNDQSMKYEFQNYKKQAAKKQLIHWCTLVSWETLLNKHSRTWKELSEKDKSNLNQSKAIVLMQKYPTLIKRPIVQKGKIIEVGFDSKTYAKQFK